jgi:hypothetical protein
MEALSYIYVIDCEQRATKIGYAKDPRKRLSELQVGCPYPLKIVKEFEVFASEVLAIELRIHEYFERLPGVRMRGEWILLPSDYVMTHMDRARRKPPERASEVTTLHALANATR